MSLVIETNYVAGVPQTILPGFLPGCTFWHWTAGAVGRAGALGTIRHFVNTRLSVNASYHLLIWWDPVGQITGAMWIVPPTNAAHSVNPAQCYQYNANIDAALQDEWFADARRCLGAKASDPNAGAIAVSFCGMPADLEVALASPVFREDVRALARQLEAIPSMAPGPHVNHGWIQPSTRYDVGEVLIPMLAQVEVVPEPEPPPPPPKPRFSDVGFDHWAWESVEWMALEGITKGNLDGTFGADTPLTAARFAVFLKRYHDSQQS